MKSSLFIVTLSWIAVIGTAINSISTGSRQTEFSKKHFISAPFQQDHFNQLRGGQDVSAEEEAVEGDVEVGTIETIKEPSAASKKLANLKERLLPAILMLAFVGGLTVYFEEQGLVILTLLLQVVMYHEMASVVGGKLQEFMKWWWFLAAAVGVNGPVSLNDRFSVDPQVSIFLTRYYFISSF